ncbi:hypothetical protein BTM22_24215 [Vibrio parahaemolyticus]|nr:hypothetical protein BTM22_24215 [Vibrio parahaemolyticus]
MRNLSSNIRTVHAEKFYITKRLRGILNAWHFQFDSALVFTAQWFRLGGSVVHPLTRRYKARRKRTFRGNSNR